jgi:DNA-binding CsgD family transcriptional regulator
VLLERANESGALASLIDGVCHGTSAVGVIEAAAGLGKSRLIVHGREQAAAAGITVFTATAREIERDFGFGIVAQLLTTVGRIDADQPLAEVAAPVMAIVAPERHTTTQSGVAPTFAALHGLYRLVTRLAEQQPLLLAVDDLHWCDAASLRFLAYLRNRLDDLPILLLCSMRPNEPSTDPAALHGLLGDPSTIWLRPRPLSVAASTTLIEAALAEMPDSEFAVSCHRITAGNPLLLEQLVSALAAEGVTPGVAHLPALEEIGAAAVGSSVLLRLGRLGDAAGRTAAALAVLGDGAELPHVADLAGLDVAAAARALAALARIDLVRVQPPLGFVHPIVAAAVYRDVPVGERDLQHLRAAKLLRRSGAPAEQVAGHLLRAPAMADHTVVDQLVHAAAVATQKGAVESAAAYLERALAEPPTAGRRVEVAWALGRAQAGRNGPAAVTNLRSVYNQLVEPEQRAEVAEQLGAVLMFTGSGDEGIGVWRAAAAALPPGSDRRRRLAAYELFANLFGVGDPAQVYRLAEYRSLREATQTGAQMLATMTAVQWMYAGGPCDAVTELALVALADGGLLATNPSWAAFALSTLTYADRDEAEGWWDRMTAAGYAVGSLTDMVSIMHGRGEALWRRGELVEAEAWIRENAIAIAQWGFNEPTPTHCQGQLAAILHDRGDLAGARRAWSAGRDVGANDPGTRGWLGRDVELLLAEGSYEATVVAAAAYAERFDALVPNPMDVPWRSLKALALAGLGRRSEARDLAETELELARAWGAPATVARTLRTLGTLESGAGGVARLEEAVSEVASSPARLEHARSLAALGTALARAQRSAAAREPLREALALATSCDARGLAARTRVDLLAAGGRPRRTAVRGVDALTPGELRVVRLVAQGRTNRAVGEELFVTPKTVAMHLSNAFRKLGVSSRYELGSALANLSHP